MQTLIKRLQGPRGPLRTWRGNIGETVADSKFCLLDRDDRRLWQWAALDSDGKVLHVIEVQIPDGYPDQLWHLREIVADFFHHARSIAN
jgi:hypothetical protein